MSLTTLPDEILIIIIKKLDLKSIYNLYETCAYTRNIVCTYGIIKECQMSLNTLATARSLKLQFFKDISRHLQELNMTGVNDLSKSYLLPAMKKLINLKTLNVAFTNIKILDLIEIHSACPTIKNITINFIFYKLGEDKLPPHQILVQCQTLFQHFENVHFVGSCFSLMHSAVASYILKKATLNNLTYTLAENQNNHFQTLTEDRTLQYKMFSIYVLNWIGGEVFCGLMLSELDVKKNEYMIIQVLGCNTYVIQVSPCFKSFFINNFGIEPECATEFTEPFHGNLVLYAWNKERTKFDSLFFSNVQKHLQQFFPCNFSSYNNSKSLITIKNDWHFVIPKLEDNLLDQNMPDKPESKRRRVAPKDFILNYDELLKDKKNVQLSLEFTDDIKNPVSLSPHHNYLKILTFLSLVGSVRYGTQFFNVLFRCCKNLVTLNVEAPSISPCVQSIARSIPLSQSIKHLRLIDKRIDFATLFSNLSLCKTLENIHIYDVSSELNDLSDPSLVFEKCPNLYYFFIYASMTNKAKTKNSQLFRKAKLRCERHYLLVELHNCLSSSNYNYDPFVSVFQLKPIKQSF